ncbi:MAG: membrane dipeptidase [Pyrinomonadaceae bacterium]|nr:membrane dipeptidase [Pyrinomonadaceae bacterium]MBP6213958.1 membrane dipeptidase [Pyrinomonadaceae bacterium]
MKTIISALLLICFGLTAFGQTMPKDADAKLWAQALKIHKKAIIIDGHNDITSPMVDEDFDLASNSVGKFHKDGDPFHTDLARLKAGGVTGEFFSIYVSGTTLKTGGAMRRAMDLIDATNREVERHPAELMSCTTAADIRRAKKMGKVCVLMGIEGGYAIENSLYALRNFYRLGIRYMTLTHNVTHDWADAHRDTPKNNGLSDFGKEVVREMNRLGMFVDISHVSEKVMNDVLDITTAPIIASHSNARAVNDHTRNVSDAVLKRVAKNGGVIMINFYPSFLDARTNKEENDRAAKLKPQLDALREQFKNDTQAYNEAERKLFAENPIYVAPYTRVVDHIDHIKQVAGIDNVGIGSDYDGVPFLPAGMNGVEDLVLITYEMLRRGYSETDIRKVLGENMLRAMSQMEKAAGSRQISGQGSLKKLK